MEGEQVWIMKEVNTKQGAIFPKKSIVITLWGVREIFRKSVFYVTYQTFSEVDFLVGPLRSLLGHAGFSVAWYLE